MSDMKDTMVKTVQNENINLQEYIHIVEEHNEKNKDNKEAPPQYQLVEWMKELHTRRNSTFIRDKTRVLNIKHFAHLVTTSLSELFGNWECNIDYGDDFVFMYNETCTIDINTDQGQVFCIIGFNTKAIPNIAAEITNILKDVFSNNVVINSDMFVFESSNNEYIWGEEAIKQHNQRISGYKLSPIIIYDTEGHVGNC